MRGQDTLDLDSSGIRRPGLSPGFDSDKCRHISPNFSVALLLHKTEELPFHPALLLYLCLYFTLNWANSFQKTELEPYSFSAEFQPVPAKERRGSG